MLGQGLVQTSSRDELMALVDADARERYAGVVRMLAEMRTDHERAAFLALVLERHKDADFVDGLRRAAWDRLCERPAAVLDLGDQAQGELL